MYVIPSEARDPQGPDKGFSAGMMKIPRLVARDDNSLYRDDRDPSSARFADTRGSR